MIDPSMRPRRACLGCLSTRDPVGPCSDSFNEAEARVPRMLCKIRWTGRPTPAFNEAEWRVPRMHKPSVAVCRGRAPFNEAEARVPRMQLIVDDHLPRDVPSMRPRRACLGCSWRYLYYYWIIAPSMRPRRACLGC